MSITIKINYNPLGDWTVYYIPAQNDGSEGTPNHGCTLDGTTPGPCFQDYPHIGADKYGVYITTNEYYPSPPSLAGFGSCSGTRTSLANWFTRITKLNP